MVSDESEQTVTEAMETVEQVLPANAFYGNRPLVCPSAFMIDDSTVEHATLSKSWPSASILLCTFHFLQLVRSLVYSQTEDELKNKYASLLQKQPKGIPPLSNTWKIYGKNKSYGHTASENVFKNFNTCLSIVVCVISYD